MSMEEVKDQEFTIRTAIYPESNIDFDEASLQWAKNKRKMPNGMYRYICIGVFKNGKVCPRKPVANKNTCRIHADQEYVSQTTEVNDILIKNVGWKPIIKSQNTTKINPFILASPIFDSGADNTLANASSDRSSRLKKCTSNVGNYARSFWKTYRTLPVMDVRASDIQIHNPTINVYDETIQIRTTPVINGTFEHLREAIDQYKTLDRIRTPTMIRHRKMDICDVVYHLQLMLSFLEGLDEMTKLETKYVNIMMLKTRILIFMEYDPAAYLHTTASQWKETSCHIQDQIKVVMARLFDAIK